MGEGSSQLGWSCEGGSGRASAPSVVHSITHCVPLLPAPNASPKDPSLSTTPLLYCPQLLAKEQQVALLQKELREVDGLLQQLDTAGGGASGGRDQQQPQQGLPVLALKKAEVGRRPASPIQGKIVMAGRVCL